MSIITFVCAWYDVYMTKYFTGVVILLFLLAGASYLFMRPSEVTHNQEPIMEEQQTENVGVVMTTNKGVIEIELFAEKAPKTVDNFVKLAGEGFYDGTQFHRVIPNFMIQGGDPLTKSDPDNFAVHGTGGPDYTFEDEINDVQIVRGVLAMANRGPDTNGSQFFLVTASATPHLDGLHTAFGKVTNGMDVVDTIEGVETDGRDHPVEKVIVEKVEVK